MLTPTEKALCRAARFTKGIGHGYGTPEDGYCPIGAVAVHRGAALEVGPDGEYTGFVRRDGQWVESRWKGIIVNAQTDICAWAGYAYVWQFLQTLERDGVAIFPRED